MESVREVSPENTVAVVNAFIAVTSSLYNVKFINFIVINPFMGGQGILSSWNLPELSKVPLGICTRSFPYNR